MNEAVASLVRDEGVAGSNPATPTSFPADPSPETDSLTDRNPKATAKAFTRWLKLNQHDLTPAAATAAELVRGDLEMLAHGGAESPAMRAKAMADIETLRAELGMVQR